MTIRLSVDIPSIKTGKLEQALSFPFGFAKDWTRLWGNPILEELGMTLLSTLPEYITIQGNDLDILEKDARIMINNLDQIVEVTHTQRWAVAQYADNLLTCVLLAKKFDGMVTIIG